MDNYGPNVSGGLTSFYHGGLQFGSDAFDDLGSSTLPSLEPSYDLDAFSTTFVDPFSYQAVFPPYIETDTKDLTEEIEEPDLDNKLLGFGPPTQLATLLDHNGQTWPRLVAELKGMFCVAEDVFQGDTSGRPLELTCYRRNLFQISGSITISRGVHSVLVNQTQQFSISKLYASLSAVDSLESKPTELICLPWKAGHQPSAATISDDKSAMMPLDIPLDLNLNLDKDPLLVTIPIAWSRLQFKNSTGNNGRRKGKQQYYRSVITISAKTEDGQIVKLFEIHSNPIVVRGRSPKNFDNSKDIPLNEQKPGSRPRNSVLTLNSGWEEPALAGTPQVVQDISSNETASTSPTRSKRLSPSTGGLVKKPPVPNWNANEALQLSKMPAVGTPYQTDKEVINRFPSTPQHQNKSSVSFGSPSETADPLYEYFPLNLDDWMPPVDAIYRPHVVHHLKIRPDMKAQQVRARQKRYFSVDD